MKKTLENGHHLSTLTNVYFSLLQNTYDKENVPSFSINLSRASEIFFSPKNVSFLEHPERRGTFVLKENNRENFFLADAENAPDTEFDDSLENVSPVKSPTSNINTYRNRPPLIFHNRDTIPPPFQPTKKYRTDDFQSKLNLFAFTPVTIPAKNLENITPTFSTKIENFLLEVTPFRELSPQNKTFELPLSNTLNMSAETYIKSNLSGDTYVKGNTSFETYVKGNTSTGTYTKDSSIGDIESLNVSPLTSKVAPCLRQNIRRTIEANAWTGMDRMELSRIEEESCNTTIVQNPFLLAATNLVDPFMTSNLYVNDRRIDEQERDFKKWLNSL
ncbi:hypothetical protein JTB14_002414 [Gonioctena quinquepunctata]|nr:hypothetical protein JTB14_002414 [Gonioctena quinquepunctata]